MPEPEEPARDDAEALELCQSAMAAFNARDLDALLAWMDPDVEWRPLRSEMEGAYHGHAGIREWLDETAELFESSQAWIDEASWEGDDLVLATGRIDLRGKGSGAPIELPVTWVFRLRDMRVLWGQAFTDHAAALAALATR
jgi:ketosteroid isomerase-like protein